MHTKRPHTSRSLASIFASVSLLAAAPCAAAGELYAVSFGLSEVYTIDTVTGTATLLGPLNQIDMSGIAFDSTGVLHGVNNDNPTFDFFVLDPPGTPAVPIVDLGYKSGEGALAFDPTANRFYSKINGSTGGGTSLQLVEIVPGTGAVTVIGNMGLNLEADISGMAVLPNGTLLGYDSQSALPDRLVVIDKLTGLATPIGLIGPIAASSVGGLAHDPDTDTLFASDGFELFTVDPLSGIGTLVGPHGLAVTISGLAVLPDPSPACLIGLDYLSTLWDVDPLTGAGSNPRPLGNSKFGGLAKSATGELFAIHHSPAPELHSIDEQTGTATLVGLLGIDLQEGGLDFDPISGDLFGVNGSAVPGVDSELFRIDTLTGAATLVGPVVDEFGGRINASALAFDAAGTLFVLKAESVPPEIYRVSPVDGTVFDRVPLPGLGFSIDGGMDFDDSNGDLLLSYENKLFRVDPYTGATLLMGPTPAVSALEVAGPCASVPSLTSSLPAISLSTGTLQTFELKAGAGNQGQPYLILGTASGTTPGLPVDGLVLPLNVDNYTLLLLAGAPVPTQTGLLGLLDTTGSASATLGFPAGLSPSLAGIVLHHAALVFAPNGSATFVSAALATTLTL